MGVRTLTIPLVDDLVPSVEVVLVILPRAQFTCGQGSGQTVQLRTNSAVQITLDSVGQLYVCIQVLMLMQPFVKERPKSKARK